MSFADELAAELAKTEDCKVCSWLETQDQSVREQFDQWVESGGQKVILWRVSARRGLKCGETTVRRHIQRCMADE